MEERKQLYKTIKRNSFAICYYEYIYYYKSARLYGNIFALLIISVSIIVGLLSKDMVMDTVAWSFSFGCFIYNYAIIKTLKRGLKKGRISKYAGIDDAYFRIIIILSRFFEVYSPFILAVIMPTLRIKLAAGAAFALFTICFKVLHDFSEAGIIAIVKKNAPYNIIMTALGVLLSMQTRMSVKANDNVIIISLCAVIGIIRYAVDRKLWIIHYFWAQRCALKDKDCEIEIAGTKGLFKLDIMNKAEFAEEIEKKKREEEEKRKRKESREQWERDSKKRFERSQEIYRACEKRRQENYRLQEQWEENARKAKAQKKLEEKILKGDESKLTSEEKRYKKELDAKLNEVKIDTSLINDRASVRR